jgi:PAS domain S-box-containing protein
VLVFRDQGPERAAARTLRESEAAYRGLFDGIGEAVYVQDVEGRFLDVNGAAERMYGIPRAEFIGKTPDFIAAPGKNDLAALPALIARALAGEPQRFEFWGRRANGEVFPKEVRLVRGNYRNQDVIIASSDDITERKLAESRLLKAQEMIRSSVAAAACFPWEWDVATDRLVWGFPPKHCWASHVLPAQISGLSRTGASGRQGRLPSRRPPHTGDRRTLSMRIPNNRHGRSGALGRGTRRGHTRAGREGRRMIGASLDITEQKRLTEEIEHHREHLEVLVAERTSELTAARAEAEHMARVKSEFLANMSHELRTPLNGVLGMARIGARDSVGRASHDVFVRIMDSGRHLLGVINDILDFSKIDAGKLVVEQRPFALAAAIDNAVGFVIGTAEQKGLHFEIERGGRFARMGGRRFPAAATGSGESALQCRSSSRPGARCACACARDGDLTYFKVIDTGVGMSAEQVARLFQPFEQGDSSTTRRYGGTGLGLAISQNLARLMGGEIDVDCTPGAGCSFTLHLPLPVAAPDLAPAASRVEGDRRLEGLRLLAAEDVEVNRLILEDLLVP